MSAFRVDCRCRCHGDKVEEHCCPECEPEAYDACADCGSLRYEHADEERPGGVCTSFVEVGAHREQRR